MENQNTQGQQHKQQYTPHTIKKYIGEDTNQPIYSRHKRHVFVMTKMARPIYVRYGDEIDLSPFLATLNTIIEKYITFFLNDKTRSHFQRVYCNEKDVIYILYRKELYYICKTSINDSPLLIESMLEFLNLQIISIVTDQVNHRLVKKPNYDFRNMLGGTSVNLGLAIKNGLTSPTVFLRSYMTVPMGSTNRGNIHNMLREFKTQESFQCILMLTHTHIIDMWYQKDFPKLQSQDILLIQNLIQAQSSFRSSENWLPICLPGISAEGFIYLFQAYLTNDICICMISDDNSAFPDCKNAYKIIQEKLQNNSNLLDYINACLKNLPYKLPFEDKNNNLLQHFMIQYPQQSQFTLPVYNTFGKQDKKFKTYMKYYSDHFQKYLKLDDENKKEFLSFSQTSEFYAGLYGNQELIIFFIIDRFASIQQINAQLKQIISWIKQEEHHYFLQKFN